MRRLLWVMVVGAVLVMVFAGVALAAFIECDGGRCEGTNRDDIIQGSNQRDRIFALDGYDDVVGNFGEDELHGGGGGDNLDGGDDSDTYYGGDGGGALFETFEETTGNDVMNGGKGGDLMDGGRGDDVLRGEEGSESLGTQGLLIRGGRGNDELYGGKGDDSMAGAKGRDRHYGGEYSDLINAAFDEEGGPDVRDFVDCGPGRDRAIVLPNDRVLGNCEDVERRRVISGVTAQEADAAAEEQQQRALERFLAEREAARETKR